MTQSPPTIYLYLHKIMIKACPYKIMTRKQALYIISRYLKFAPILKKEVLNDMLKYKLLERVNRDVIKIINDDKSAVIDNAILIKIIESGRMNIE